MTQQLHSGHVSQINEDLCSRKNWYTNVYNGIVGDGNNLKITQTLSSMCFIHPTGYYSSINKEQTIETQNTVDQSQQHWYWVKEDKDDPKIKYSIISVLLHSQNDKDTATENKGMISRG